MVRSFANPSSLSTQRSKSSTFLDLEEVLGDLCWASEIVTILLKSSWGLPSAVHNSLPLFSYITFGGKSKRISSILATNQKKKKIRHGKFHVVKCKYNGLAREMLKFKYFHMIFLKSQFQAMTFQVMEILWNWYPRKGIHPFLFFPQRFSELSASLSNSACAYA